MINYNILSSFESNLEFNTVKIDHLKSVVGHLRTISIPLDEKELLEFETTLKKIKKLAKKRLSQSEEISVNLKDKFIIIIKAKKTLIEARKKEIEAYKLFDNQLSKGKEESECFRSITAMQLTPPDSSSPGCSRSFITTSSYSTSLQASPPPLSEASRSISSTSTQAKEQPKSFITITAIHPSPDSFSSTSSQPFTPSLSETSRSISSTSTQVLASSTSHLPKHEPHSIVPTSKSRDLALKNNPTALFQVRIEDLQQITTELMGKPKLDIEMSGKIENCLDVFKIHELRFLSDEQIAALSEAMGGLSEEFQNKPNQGLYREVYSKNIISICVEIDSIVNSREEEKERIIEIEKTREKELKQLCDQMKINVNSQLPLTSQALIVFQASDLENRMTILFNEIHNLSMKSTIDWPRFWQLVDQAFILIAKESIHCIDSTELDKGFLQLKMIMTRLNNLSTTSEWSTNEQNQGKKYRLNKARYKEYSAKFVVLNQAVSKFHASLDTRTAVATAAPVKPLKPNDFASKQQSLDALVKQLRALSATRSNLGLELIEKFFMIAYAINFDTYTNEELDIIQSHLREVENFAKTFKSSTYSIYAQHLIDVIEALKKTSNRQISESEDKYEPYLPQEYIDFLKLHLEKFDELKNHEKMALYEVLQGLCVEIAYLVGNNEKLLNQQIERMADKISLILQERELDFPESNMLSILFRIKDVTMPKEFDALSLLSPQEQKNLTPSEAAATSLKYKRKLFADMKEAKELALKQQNQKKIDLLNLFHPDKAPLRLSRSNSNNGEATDYGSPSPEEQQIISGFMTQFFKKN